MTTTAAHEGDAIRVFDCDGMVQVSRWYPKVLETIGWLALVPMFGLCITQWFGIEGRRSIAAFQALTPWVLVWAAPIALTACVARRHPLALVSLVPVFTMLTLSYPIVFHADAPKVAAASPRLTVAFTNALYINPTPADAARTLSATDADVLVVAEFVPGIRRALDDAVRPGDYPYRAESVYGGSGAIGMWSRFPIIDGGVIDIGEREAIDVVLNVDGHDIRVLAVHPYAPTFSARGWVTQLSAIGDRAESTSYPTLIVGDFNASRWHPSFRTLLGRGWSDVHETLGHGWSVSWPMDEGVIPPAFVRIDHALFGGGLTPTSIRDLEIPGSDHKGFVVTVGLTQAALTPTALKPGA